MDTDAVMTKALRLLFKPFSLTPNLQPPGSVGHSKIAA